MDESDTSTCIILLPYNRNTTSDPMRVNAFRNKLRELPSNPFWIEPTSHCLLLNEFVRRAAAHAIGKPNTLRVKKKCMITTTTFAAIEERICASKSEQRLGRILAKSGLRAVFFVWANAANFQRPCVRCSAARGFSSSRVVCERLRAHVSYKTLSVQVVARLRLERAAAIEAVAQRQRECFTNRGNSTAFQSCQISAACCPSQS